MNKTLTILLIISLPLFLTACTKTINISEKINKNASEVNTAESKEESATAQDNKQNTTLENPTKNNQEQGNANIFTSVKDALSKKLTLKCAYKAENGQESTVYIKGDKLYQEGKYTIEGRTTSYQGVLRDNKYYFWTDLTPQGMVFDLEKAESMAQTAGQKIETADDIINKLEDDKQACTVTTISDSKFEVPSDITFLEF